MVNLVDEEDIRRELEDFNLTVDDREVLTKMKELSILYDKTADDLVASWWAFTSKSKTLGAPTLPLLEQFEQNMLHKKLSNQIQKSVKKERHSLRASSTGIPIEPNLLQEYGVSFAKIVDVQEKEKRNDAEAKETKLGATVEEPLTDADKQDLSQKEDDELIENIKDEPMEVNVILHEKEVKAEEQMDEEVESMPSKKVVCYSGESLSEKDWINKKGTGAHAAVPYSQEGHVWGPFKYMQLRLHELEETMNEVVEESGETLLEKSGLDKWEDIGAESAAAEHFVGRVCGDSSKGKINDQSLLLEGTSFIRKRSKLNLTNVSDFALFPGQVVGVKGVNEGDNGLLVESIMETKLASCPFPSAKLQFKQALHLIVASGPFSSSSPKEGEKNPIEKLLEYVENYEPHFVILLGPFIGSNDIIGNEDPEKSLREMIDTISRALLSTKTEAILIPSDKDINSFNILPSPPFSSDIFYKRKMHFMPNPCTLNISGLVVGLTSADILLHLSREEVSRFSTEQQSGQRMKRLCHHLLSQRSFYPLFPPNGDISVDYSKYSFLRLPVTPHLMILPSDLKHFSKNVEGCVCLNPERLSKGTFARIKVDSPSDPEYAGSLENYINVEVLKL